MAILQMQRVSICALKKDRKAILEKIQSLGVMEMSQVAEDEKGFEKMDTLSARQDFEKKTHLTEAALHVLDLSLIHILKIRPYVGDVPII